MGQCRNGDDEHKRISFAVIITITQSLEKKKDNPFKCKNTMASATILMNHTPGMTDAWGKWVNYSLVICNMTRVVTPVKTYITIKA